MRNLTKLGIAASLLACAAPGRRPRDMSASGHDERGSEEERIAASLGPGKDLEQMRFRHKLADEHRRAARVLREAEERACRGLREEERRTEPFPPARILAVAPMAAPAEGTSAAAGTRGAIVQLRLTLGEPAQELKRRIECSQARNAVLGANRAGAAESPFAVPGVTVLVRDSGDASIVELHVADQREADDLLERLRRYAAR